jgi:hypothetical protein
MAFTGLVTSDFMKRVRLDDSKKESLLDFAATDFFTLRENLVKYVQAAYPLDYNFFASSDLGIMFLELTAAMGHILSYKADYLANENYLRTARSRDSVKNLLELIGIRMKGPTGSAANARLTLTQPKWSAASDYLTISPSQRVATVTSPEDGTQLSFTLYKTTPGGLIEFTSPSEEIQIQYNENSSSSILNNLVFLEGSLVKQTGQFSDTDALKNIYLNQSPLIEGSVQVYIEGSVDTEGAYTQVENIFAASGPSDKVYQLATDINFTGRVFFGDNLIGQSPNNGDTYTVYYRIGGGTRGNLSKNTLSVPVNVSYFNSSNTSLGTGQATATNTSMATGGSDAQTIENAKRYAPLLFRSQDRLVTLNDYKGFVNSFRASMGLTGKATATVRRAFSSANIIDVYILEKANNTQMRRATPEFKRQLLEAIEPKKMLTDEVVVVDGLIRTIDPVITVRCDLIYKQREPEIKIRVRDSITEFFSVDNLDFGKTYNSLEVTRKIFNDVPEVRYSTVDNLPQTIKLQFNEIIQLNNLVINMVFE